MCRSRTHARVRGLHRVQLINGPNFDLDFPQFDKFPKNEYRKINNNSNDQQHNSIKSAGQRQEKK